MDNKKCPSCGTEVHFDDDVCYACGANVPRSIPWLAYLVGGVIAVALFLGLVDWSYWIDYFSKF